jgi:hypothetical protein
MLVEKLTGVRVEQLVVDCGRASGVTVMQLVVVVVVGGGGGYRQKLEEEWASSWKGGGSVPVKQLPGRGGVLVEQLLKCPCRRLRFWYNTAHVVVQGPP